MYEELNKYIKEFEKDDSITDSFWAESASDDAIDMIDDFSDEDWEQLFQELPNQSPVWKRRLESALVDTDNFNVVKALVVLAQTEEDMKHLSYVIDSLGFAQLESNEDTIMLLKRIQDLLKSENLYGKKVLNDFFEKNKHLM